MKKIDSLMNIYIKSKINDKTDIEILENNESFIIFKYNDATIKAFVDKKDYKKFVIEHYKDKKWLKDIDIVTFLTQKELIEFLKEV